MIVTAVGITIYILYSLVGKGEKLTSLGGYPRWYQDMIVRQAAKQATQDQQDVISAALCPSHFNRQQNPSKNTLNHKLTPLYSSYLPNPLIDTQK